ETAAQTLARELRALRLRDASASGRWADGLLQLHALRVRTSDAELSGSAQLRLAAAPASPAVSAASAADPGPGGGADLRFTAPGVTLTLKGQAQPDSGAGTLRAQVADASRLLDWARQLPGAAEPLAPLRASGSATLEADWRGGWRDPAVQARLAVPRLQLTPGAQAEPVDLRGLQAQLQGRQTQARLSLQGSAAQGPRALDLRLSAEGGRTRVQQPLAESAWRLNISGLQASARAPELGQGSWQLAQRGASLPLSWNPAQGGRLEVGAGELVITSPAPVAQAQLAWGPSQWQAGQLRTTGRLTGLPLEWAERLAGTQMAQAGLTGNVVFNGDWDLALGDTLRVQASLARASGDLTVLTTDAQTGVQSRVPAGLREARVQLASDGRALHLNVRWDSAQAGTVDGQLSTQLAATRSASGRTQWAWPADAPLSGQLQAKLPQMAAWSVLAPPGWRLRGALNADARLGGTRTQPLVTGTLGADGLALRSVVDGVQLEDGRLRARLDGTRVLIDEFLLRGAGDASGQGGLIRASGEAGWIDGRAQARLNATLEQLRASIRADRQVSASGQVQAALDGRQISVDGRLRVDRARIVLPEESAPSLGDDVIVRGPGGKVMYGKTAPGAVAAPTSAAGQQPASAAPDTASGTAPDAASTPLTARVNVQLDLGEDFLLQGMGIDTRLTGQLTLAANGPLTAMPRLSGTVRTASGTFRAYGQRLNITRGNIVFSGAIDNPALDIIALRPNYASDQRVGAQVMGTALLPRVRLYSEPALPDNEALAWLLLGRAAPSTGAEAAMLQSAALAVLGGREGRGLAARFGLDELSFSGGDGGDVASASVTLGKRLSDRLYAAYEHSLAGASGSLLIFYELSRRWTLRGQAGENAAIDLIYRISFD
ncbi:MAG: translocation/assembly module TamB domain-containing protein, partial [Pseudomonadota bacterium]|nr:translocation/assembly module TamB domain-containing protein [Pseudomonadota bacterium]